MMRKNRILKSKHQNWVKIQPGYGKSVDNREESFRKLSRNWKTILIIFGLT